MSQSVSSISFSEDTLFLKGSFTFNTVSELQEKGLSLLEKVNAQQVVLNLKEMRRIDSAGIALLLEWKRYCQNNNKDLKLIEAQDQATSLIKTYKLQSLFSA